MTVLVFQVAGDSFQTRTICPEVVERLLNFALMEVVLQGKFPRARLLLRLFRGITDAGLGVVGGRGAPQPPGSSVDTENAFLDFF